MGAPLEIQGGHGSLGRAKLCFFTPQPGEVWFYRRLWRQSLGGFRHRTCRRSLFFFKHFYVLFAIDMIEFSEGEVVFFYSSAGQSFFF